MQILFTLELYDAGFRIRKELERLYPKCFFPVGLEKPLKIGIMEDLLAIREALNITPTPTEEELRAAILIYTGCLSYRVSLILDGSARVDLEGNECGVVTDAERLIAKSRPLTPHWKLTDEELNIVREKRQEAYQRRERYLADKEQQESQIDSDMDEQVGTLENASSQPIEVGKSEPQPEIVNPNLSRPKLTLKKSLES